MIQIVVLLLQIQIPTILLIIETIQIEHIAHCEIILRLMAKHIHCGNQMIDSIGIANEVENTSLPKMH